MSDECASWTINKEFSPNDIPCKVTDQSETKEI